MLSSGVVWEVPAALPLPRLLPPSLPPATKPSVLPCRSHFSSSARACFHRGSARAPAPWHSSCGC